MRPPLRLARRPLRASARRLAALAVLAVVVLALVLVAARRVHEPVAAAEAVPSTAASSAAETQAAKRAACLGAPVLVPSSGCASVPLGSVVYPDPSVLASDSALQYDCWVQTFGRPTSCRYGSTAASAPRVALVGDSRAAALLPGLLADLAGTGWSLTTYLGDGCVLSDTVVDRCSGARTAFIGAVTQPGAYRLVITAADRGDGLTAASFEPVFARVVQSGAKLAVVRDVPRIQSSALACATASGFDPATQTCATAQSTAMAGTDPLIAATAATKGASLIDLTPYFCVHERCPAVVGDVFVYRDTAADLTTTYSRTLGPYLLRLIRERTHV